MTNFEEIERRFLVDGREEKPWRINSKSSQIKQFYFPEDAVRVKDGVLMMGEIHIILMQPEELELWSSRPGWGGRLRVRDGLNIVTCKSRKSDDTAYELEWEVSPEIGEAVGALGPYPHVEKTRYVWSGADGGLWEIDEFEGALAGLILAEIELSSPDQTVEIPKWVGHEITGLSSWSNKSLANTLGS